LVLLAVLVFAVLRSGGPLRRYLAAWQEPTESVTLAQKDWQALAKTGARRGDGDSSAPPLTIEFGDYQCPACMRSYRQLDALLTANPSVSIGFRHYPTYPNAEDAARAAICAEAQGRFSDMHAVLFESGAWRVATEPNWTVLAERARVPDLAEFEACLTGSMVEARLAEDLRLAKKLGVTSLPTYFYWLGPDIGSLSVGSISEERLTTLLEAGP
jgi:protein-disulfide isomerase